NRLIRCVCGKKIGPDPRNFNQRVSLGRNDLLIRTFLSCYRHSLPWKSARNNVLPLPAVLKALQEKILLTPDFKRN
ncbi:hypothetical protein ACWJSV_18260, partial [Klebsiella pneumoniae]